MKKYFTVSGMSCAACSARVDSAVRSLPFVSEVTVNLLTGSMTVETDSDISEKEFENNVITAVRNAGYEANAGNFAFGNGSTETKERKKSDFKKISLLFSLIMAFILLYVTMGQMLGAPVPAFLHPDDHPLFYTLVQFILSSAVIFINRTFFINGLKNLIRLSPNMDSLIFAGSGISYIYSIIIAVFILAEVLDGNTAAAFEYTHSLFFESAGMIPAVLSIGKYLESHSKDKTTESIKKLIKLRPATAILYSNDEETEIPAESICPGDILSVRQGYSIPCDGEVFSQTTDIDESMLTGESRPVRKNPGDPVYEATLCIRGSFKMKASGTGENTVFSHIIQMISDAASAKAPIERLADKISRYFVPVVFSLSVITFMVWMLTGSGLSFAISMAVSVMVISCPCSLGLATPTAIMTGTGRAAELGILIKSAEALETLHKCDTFVFDKTGTITTGIVSDDKQVYNDKLRNDAASAVEALKKMNITCIMLSGDREEAAADAAIASGMNSYHSGLTPGDKQTIINKLRSDGHTVAMVGDGINDAPSLHAADIGIAIGTGTDVAVESADIVITGTKLWTLVTAFKLGITTIKNIRMNLFWALFYNCLGIPVAAGVLYPAFGIKLNPMIAAICMSLSSLFVVTNALRLRRFDNIENKGDTIMKTVIEIDGMMCEHCKARVEQILSALDGVQSVTVDLTAKNACIVSGADIDTERIKETINTAGYKFIGIK